MKKYIIGSITGLLFIGYFPAHAAMGVSLVKSPISDTVYMVDENSTRHPFPNRMVYESWYGDDFSRVATVPVEEIAKMPLGKSIVARSGKFLLKVPSSPEVYAVEPGGVLRHIENLDLMLQLYGEDWQKRVRDISEVFFDQYIVGEPLNDIPNGTVYKVEGDAWWYWKDNGIIEPFASEQDIYANGYAFEDIIVGDKGFFGKRKPISGVSDRIFNPLIEPKTSTASCTTNNLHAAVIFLTKDDTISTKELGVLNTTVQKVPEAFSYAAHDLAKLSVDSEFFVMQDPRNYFLSYTVEGKPYLDLEQVALAFYETEKDDYDFLIVYNDYIDPLDYTEKAVYQLVRNDFLGTNRLRLNRSKYAGSNGRLKGFVNMHKIDQYSASSDEGVASLLGLINHEVLHHWSGSVSYLNNASERSYTLLEEDRGHWSTWLTTISPLGGWGWVKTEGTNEFTSGLLNRSTTALKTFTDLDLYLMGLVPARYIDPIGYIVPDDPNTVSDHVTGHLEYVDIDQIVTSHGEWKCDIIP